MINRIYLGARLKGTNFDLGIMRSRNNKLVELQTSQNIFARKERMETNLLNADHSSSFLEEAKSLLLI